MAAELKVKEVGSACIGMAAADAGDAIRQNRCKFHDAAREMSPEDLLELTPMASPMTHEVGGCDLIARCPVDAWERAGRKAFAAQSRRESALKIAENGEGNLYRV
eukprot:3942875-Pyramimonas_sp.AAC.1